jgi:chromosome segregation ATPase
MQTASAILLFVATVAFFLWILWHQHREVRRLRRHLDDDESKLRDLRDRDQETLDRATRLCGLCEAGEPDSIPDAIERLYLAYQHNKPILEGYKQDFRRVQSQLEVLASERDILHRHWEGATKESAALREELERTMKQLERMHADLTETTRQVVHFESNERDLSALLPEMPAVESASLLDRVRLLISERDSLRTSFDSVMRQRDSLLRDVRDLLADLDSTKGELRVRTTERNGVLATLACRTSQRDDLAKDNVGLRRGLEKLREELDTVAFSLRLDPKNASSDDLKNALGGLFIARDHLDAIEKALTEAKFHPELTFVGRLERLLAERRELQSKASQFVQLALTIGADRPDPEFVLARAQSLQSRLDGYANQVEDLQTRLSEANREAMVGQNLSDRLVALRNVLRKGLVNRSRATKPRQFPVVLVRKNYGLSWVDSERVCGFLNLEPRKLL